MCVCCDVMLIITMVCECVSVFFVFVFFFNLPSVLVPGLDLCVCQVESRGQVHAVLHAEVFLSLEASLQLVELVVREGCPCFARLFRAHGRNISATGVLSVALFLSP